MRVAACVRLAAVMAAIPFLPALAQSSASPPATVGTLPHGSSAAPLGPQGAAGTSQPALGNSTGTTPLTTPNNSAGTEGTTTGAPAAR